MKLLKYTILVACTGFLVGCAATIPEELSNARIAYQRASVGEAAQLVPAELHKAKEALERAEASFSNDSGSFRTKDLAYVAERKAIMAETLASIASQKGSATQANKDYQTTQNEIIIQNREDLARAKTEMAEAAAASEADKLAVKQQARFDSEKQATDAAAAAAAEELAVERQARLDAEKRAVDAQA